MLKLIKSNLDPVKLLTASQQFDYKLDGSGAYMLVSQSEKPELNLTLWEAVSEIEKIRNLTATYIMINNLPPKTEVPKHRDWIKGTPLQKIRPKVERWHLPLLTNKDTGYWDEISNENKYMPLGFWCGPIPYWKMHYVWNRGETWRVHLIVDLDTPIPLGLYEEEENGHAKSSVST